LILFQIFYIDLTPRYEVWRFLIIDQP